MISFNCFDIQKTRTTKWDPTCSIRVFWQLKITNRTINNKWKNREREKKKTERLTFLLCDQSSLPPLMGRKIKERNGEENAEDEEEMRERLKFLDNTLSCDAEWLCDRRGALPINKSANY